MSVWCSCHTQALKSDQSQLASATAVTARLRKAFEAAEAALDAARRGRDQALAEARERHRLWARRCLREALAAMQSRLETRPPAQLQALRAQLQALATWVASDDGATGSTAQFQVRRDEKEGDRVG